MTEQLELSEQLKSAKYKELPITGLRIRTIGAKALSEIDILKRIEEEANQRIKRVPPYFDEQINELNELMQDINHFLEKG